MAMLIPAALSSMSGLATAGAALSAASGVLGTVSSVQNANAQAKSLDAAATAHFSIGSGSKLATIKIKAENPPRVLPPRDGVYLKNRFRAALGHAPI